MMNHGANCAQRRVGSEAGMRMRRGACVLIATAALAAALALFGCAGSGQGSGSDGPSGASHIAGQAQGVSVSEHAGWDVSDAAAARAPRIEGLEFDHALSLEYATGFDVFYYRDAQAPASADMPDASGMYKLVDIKGGDCILAVPPDGSAPEALPDGVQVVKRPLASVYLCASAAASLIDVIGGLGAVTMSGTDEDGWQIEGPRRAMEDGSLAFAGRYNAPDYEMLVDRKCDLALESTMILRAPEVVELLAGLGIPVLTERSSYEEAPLGRTEWVKLYGALLDREEEAESFFAAEAAAFEAVAELPGTDKTIALFYINPKGAVVVRQPGDYLARCIELGGGKYAFADMDAPGNSPTVSLTMEEFYQGAVHADYLVYNGTIYDSIASVDDLIAENEAFADFDAVRSGSVWVVGKDMFQSTDKIAALVADFRSLVDGGVASDMTFLAPVS